MSEQTSVYIYSDDAGHVLYVGITARNIKRAQEHARTKAWWPQVSAGKIEHYETREHALAVEAYLIKHYQPPYNTQGKDSVRAADRDFVVTHDFIRSIMGRLSRPQSLAEVDIDKLAPKKTPGSFYVREAYFKASNAGESVADFRKTVKTLLVAEPEMAVA